MAEEDLLLDLVLGMALYSSSLIMAVSGEFLLERNLSSTSVKVVFEVFDQMDDAASPRVAPSPGGIVIAVEMDGDLFCKVNISQSGPFCGGGEGVSRVEPAMLVLLLFAGEPTIFQEFSLAARVEVVDEEGDEEVDKVVESGLFA